MTSIDPLEGRTHFASPGPGPVPAALVAPNLQHSVSQLTVPRFFLAGANAAGAGVFAGGDDLGGVTDVVDVYHPIGGSVTRLGSLTVARDELAGAAVDETLLFVGGSGHSKDVDLYDLATGRWATARLSVGRTRPAAVAVGGRALIVGDSGVPSKVADVYDAATRHWSTAKLPVACTDATAAVAGGRAIILPGIGSENPTGRLDVYDSVTQEWTTLSPPDDFEFSGPATAVGTKAIFAGAAGVAIYDTVDNRWSAAPFAGLVIQGAATSVGAKALFAGLGGTVDVYDAATGQWGVAPFSAGRSLPAATTVGNQAVFAGGQAGPAFPSAAVDVYTDTAPVPVLSGTVSVRHGTTATVTVTNTGDADYSGAYAVQVYATPPHRLKGAVLLGSVTLNRHLAPGSSVRVAVPLTVPAGVAPGTYHYVAAVAQASDTAHPTPVAGGSTPFRLGGAASSASSPASRPAVAAAVSPFARAPLIAVDARRRDNGLFD